MIPCLAKESTALEPASSFFLTVLFLCRKSARNARPDTAIRASDQRTFSVEFCGFRQWLAATVPSEPQPSDNYRDVKE
jgi:GrpB-like predicted nucleotidyltransferase (UPF0157 family)